MAILEVPIELLPMFMADPSNFIRDIANFPQESISRFFRNPLVIRKAVKRSLPNPYDFKTHQLSPDFYAKSPAPRFMHFDLSLGGDLCTFAMGYSDHFIEGSYLREGKLIYDYLPFINIEMVGVMLVGRNEEVWLPEIPQLINNLSDRGFNLSLITFDRFQSAYIMQELRDQGYLTAWLSIDRTTSYPVIDMKTPGMIRRISTDKNYTAAISTLKDALNQERIIIPQHPNIDDNSTEESEFEVEAKVAEIDLRKNKVDHPPEGRIDLLQAIAGVTFNIQNNVKSIDQKTTLPENISDNFYGNFKSEEDKFDKPIWEDKNESYLG